MGMLDFITSPVASLAGGALSFLGQQGANQQNMENAQAQMAFQREMSNTSYQRAVDDMKAAGLSPMLAYSQGGASVPTGAMPVVQNKLGAGVEAFQKGMSTSSASQLANAQIEQSASAIDLNTANAAKSKAEAINIAADTANKAAMNPVIVKQLEELAAKIENLHVQSKLGGAQTSKTYQEVNIAKPKEAFSTENPQLAKWKDPVLQSFKMLIDSINPISKVIPKVK